MITTQSVRVVVLGGLMALSGVGAARAQTAPLAPSHAPGDSEKPTPDAAKPGVSDPAKAPEAKDPKAKAPPVKAAVLPKDVVQASKQLRDEAPCGACHGHGKVDQPRITHRRSVARGVSAPEGVVDKVSCKTCEGLCVAKTERLARLCETLVTNLGSVDVAHAEWAKQVDRIKGNLKAAAKVGLPGWAVRLTDMKRKLNSGTMKQGQAVMIVGGLGSDVTEGGVRRITLTVDDDSKLVLEDPRIVDALSGHTVLVGGLYDRADGNDHVIRSGFVVDAD
jgi:hypothetical protein